MAAAYYYRGDTGHAVRICRKAIAKAETLASPTARAAAYWNASLFESEQGSVADAVPLAERALSLLAEGQDGRNLALLRTQLGMMQLQLDPPEVGRCAGRNLEKAAEELTWSSASTIEIARNAVSRARAHYLDGNLTRAEDMCLEILVTTVDEAPLLAADAQSLAGQVASARGDAEGAKSAYRRAVFLLTGVGADRDAAQLWFELADLLEDVGDVDAARDAYRSAAASSGLRSRASCAPTCCSSKNSALALSSRAGRRFRFGRSGVVLPASAPTEGATATTPRVATRVVASAASFILLLRVISVISLCDAWSPSSVEKFAGCLGKFGSLDNHPCVVCYHWDRSRRRPESPVLSVNQA